MNEIILTAWIMTSPYKMRRFDMIFESMSACLAVEDSFRIPIPRRNIQDIFWYGGGEGFSWLGCREVV